MSEFFLAVNLPTKQGFPPHRPPSYAGPDLDLEFDITSAGLTSTIHKEPAEVSRTLTTLPKLQIDTFLLLTVVREREEKDSNLQE